MPVRAVLEAVQWILSTGAQGHLLPQCYPNYKTVHRRFQYWCRSEVLRGLLVGLANTLREDGALEVTECFIDARFAPAKGGHHEVRLVQLSLDFYMLEARPETLIGGRPYGSGTFDEDLKAEGIEMIAPRRTNRKKRRTQNGRRLRRYERRWIVERLFPWMQWRRRFLLQWEYYAENFLGFVQPASMLILLLQF